MRFLKTALPALALLPCLGAIAVPPLLTAAQDYNLRPRIQQGLRIAPVPLDMRGKDRKLVGLGSYLVNSQSECVSCHTRPAFAPGSNPFLGERGRVNTVNYLAGGEAFGPFVSSNITPDVNGNPGGLTFEEFQVRIRTGLTPNHPQFGPFIQVMPWPALAEMSDQELRAIYEYLRAIPHAEPAGAGAKPRARN
ncbi:MAG: CytoChrome c, class [Armatimonadetes bacterium]|nr:CytoChrome c, class [Armatimonadota bacterium]